MIVLYLFTILVWVTLRVKADVNTPMSETTNNDMAKAPWWFI